MDGKKQDILTRLEQMEAENRRLQALLTDAVSLLDYRPLVRGAQDALIWTDALQTALREHEIVRIPAGLYWLDASVVMPSNRRIEAEEGAVLRLIPGARLLMLRSENTQNGTHRPIAPGTRTQNIAIVGGRWEESNERRAGYGQTGLYDEARSFFGVSTCLFFNNVQHLTLSNMTFRHTAGFAVQAGDASDVLMEHITFEECFADGLHLNGGMQNVVVRDVRGQVGDDLVALNLYDWQNSSVDFGPMDTVLCEDLFMAADSRYKAMRIEPGIYYYDDGSCVDCALTHAIIRRVRGVKTFKLYYQTPRYRVGVEQPERGGVGSGDWIFFEDIEVDLDGPIDRLPGYVDSDPVRGAFGAFEIGANIGHISFENIRLTRSGRFPLAFFAVVGPKSVYLDGLEIFDPYAGCRVGEMRCRGIWIDGAQPESMEPYVRRSAFYRLYENADSTACGEVERINYLR